MNALMYTAAAIVVLSGVLLVVYFSRPILGARIGWPNAFMISVGAFLAGTTSMVMFSSRAPDSTFFTLLPFLAYYVAAGILIRLFVKVGTERIVPGFAESFLLAFVQFAGTVISFLAVMLVGLVFYMAAK